MVIESKGLNKILLILKLDLEGHHYFLCIKSKTKGTVLFTAENRFSRPPQLTHTDISKNMSQIYWTKAIFCGFHGRYDSDVTGVISS